MKKLLRVLLSYRRSAATRILHGSRQECRTWFEQEHRILRRSRGSHRTIQFQANPVRDYHWRNAHSFENMNAMEGRTYGSTGMRHPKTNLPIMYGTVEAIGSTCAVN
jgi:hypothetical protein